jgi:hypothetical protein
VGARDVHLSLVRGDIHMLVLHDDPLLTAAAISFQRFDLSCERSCKLV